MQRSLFSESLWLVQLRLEDFPAGVYLSVLDIAFESKRDAD